MAGRRRPLRPLAGIRRRRAGKTRSGVVARAGQPHAGEVLSRYAVKYLPGTKKRARVSRPRLFETSGCFLSSGCSGWRPSARPGG